MNNPLAIELQHHEYLRQKIIEDFPDIDEETLIDTLEGLTNLHEKLAAIVRSQQEDRVLLVALKDRMDEMRQRYKRLEHRIEKKGELVSSVMDRAGIAKIIESDVTISIRQTPRPLVLTNENAIPEDYWRPQAPKLDRKKLIDYLKTENPISGACLGNGGVTVSVRVS
jgi:hypothetical protein